MFDWLKGKSTGSASDADRLLEAAIREVHPDRFVDDLDAALVVQPRLVALNTLLDRPQEERFRRVSFDDLVQSVRGLHRAGVLSQVIAHSRGDTVTTALIAAAIQEGQPGAGSRPQAEQLLNCLNAHGRDRAAR